MIKSEIILDSINLRGNRLTTCVFEYPRFVHAELMTHRVFSRNAASSRAIPIQKFIENITNNPALPEHWGKNKSGMQANEEISDELKIEAQRVWLESRDSQIQYANKLANLGVHKQIVNRLIEPWFHIKVLVTSSDFDNFLKLRAHPDAQPEIRTLAYMFKEQYEKSIPKKLSDGDWHIPFQDKMYAGIDVETKLKVATARCARVSYNNFEGTYSLESDLAIYEKLLKEPLHASPFEHIAMSEYHTDKINNRNFGKGWLQYRAVVERNIKY